jgi:hypothetical protein
LKIRDILAYILGTILIIYGSYAGRDLTNINEAIEGTAMIVVFIGLFLIFAYMKRHEFVGDWSPKSG